MKLMKSNFKDNYKNYPRNMYFARALSNACRWYCPEVIQGYYTVEELQDLNETVGVPAVGLPAKTTIDITLEANNASPKTS